MCINSDAIKRFVEYFRNQGSIIASVEPILYRKLLYVSALDPIARAAFGNAGNRSRSIRLVEGLTNWVDRDRVSLPQLCLALSSDHASSPLFSEANARLRTWRAGEIVLLHRSPSLVELESLAQESEKRVLADCKYSELYYAYRNYLVHEFREPGHAIEFSSDEDQPYYHAQIGGSWQLVFPVQFFARLFDEALTGLEGLLMSSDSDPYRQFEFGSRWRLR